MFLLSVVSKYNVIILLRYAQNVIITIINEHYIITLKRVY